MRVLASSHTRLFRSCFIALALSFTGGAWAASTEESCQVWSNMAQKMATERDAGIPPKVWTKRIDGLVGARGVSDDNIAFMRNLLILVYKDFRNKSPEQISTITYTGCMVM